jgi:hypothetical protein
LVVLSCDDVALCERCVETPPRGALYAGVKVRTQALTCVRALPGDWVTTSALARLATRGDGVTPARTGRSRSG